LRADVSCEVRALRASARRFAGASCATTSFLHRRRHRLAPVRARRRRPLAAAAARLLFRWVRVFTTLGRSSRLTPPRASLRRRCSNHFRRASRTGPPHRRCSLSFAASSPHASEQCHAGRSLGRCVARCLICTDHVL
jgi:hypothetical protein